MLPVLKKSACVSHLTPLSWPLVRVPNPVLLMYDGMVYSVCVYVCASGSPARHAYLLAEQMSLIVGQNKALKSQLFLKTNFFNDTYQCYTKLIK